MRERRLSVNGMLIFLIYGMFALFSLLLVVIGARVYRTVAAVGEENTAVRTSFSYLANKLRMEAGTEGDIRLEEREGYPLLVIGGSGQTEEYETLIYYYDGMLWEYFGAAGQSFEPGKGEKLIEAAGFTIEEPEPGLFYLELSDAAGNQRGLHLSSRGMDRSQKREE